MNLDVLICQLIWICFRNNASFLFRVLETTEKKMFCIILSFPVSAQSFCRIEKNETSNDNLNGLIRWDIHNTLTIIGLSIAETFHQLWFSPDI